jgi:hypothetical protein
MSEQWYRLVTERVRRRDFKEICDILEAHGVRFLAPQGQLLEMLQCMECVCDGFGGWQPCTRMEHISLEQLLDMQALDREFHLLLR